MLTRVVILLRRRDYVIVLIVPLLDSNSIFFQSKIAAINESGSRDWWKQIKLIMGLHRNTQPDMQSLANNIAEGDYEILTNIMIYCFASVSSHLPRIRNNDPFFPRMDELPDQYIMC